MCLAIPMRLTERTEFEGEVELDGISRTVSLMLLPDAEVGQHLLIHAGYAIGAVDEEGNYFTTQMILSTAYWHVLTHRKKRWNISRSASTTRMVDYVAEQNGLNCIETPVGFKYIAEKMVAGEADIGGEESGRLSPMRKRDAARPAKAGAKVESC